jgi:hypothetical protein
LLTQGVGNLIPCFLQAFKKFLFSVDLSIGSRLMQQRPQALNGMEIRRLSWLLNLWGFMVNKPLTNTFGGVLGIIILLEIPIFSPEHKVQHCAT